MKAHRKHDGMQALFLARKRVLELGMVCYNCGSLFHVTIQCPRNLSWKPHDGIKNET